jgi:tetratricopeptide (TPR) repeat protein
MDILPLVPLSAHLPCSVAICDYLSSLIARYSPVRPYVVDLGTVAVKYPVSEDFLRSIHAQTALQLSSTGDGLTPNIAAIGPDIDGGFLIRGEVCNVSMRPGFLDQFANPVHTDELRAGLILTFHMLVRSVHLPEQQDQTQFYEFAVSWSDELEVALETIGTTFAQKGMLQKARSAWTQVLEGSQSGSPRAALNIGQSYSDEGNLEEAEEWLSRGIKLCTGDERSLAIGLYDRGLVRAQQQRLREAIDDFNACLMAAPEFAAAYNSLGAALIELGDRGAAETCFRNCLALPDADSESTAHARENLRLLA